MGNKINPNIKGNSLFLIFSFRLLPFAIKRNEEKAKIGNIIIIDDYAHHPTAIKSALEAAKQKYPRYKIYCIFQPHTFSRTKRLLNSFASSFIEADKVLVADIFPSAREQPDPAVSSILLTDEMNKYKSNARYVSGQKNALKYLTNIVSEDSILITMGAGDLYIWHDNLITLIKKYDREL